MFWRKSHESEQKRLLEELSAIRQELGHIRELLERFLNEELITLLRKAPQATLSESEAESAAVADAHSTGNALCGISNVREPESEVETVTKSPTPPPMGTLSPQTLVHELTNRLRSRQLSIERYLLVQGGTPMEEEMYHLSFFIGQHYASVEPWLSRLRATLSHPAKTHHHLNGAFPDQISVMTNLGSRLYRLRMLSSYEYDRANSELVAKVDSNPDSINYLSGGWFEMCVFQAVRKILDSLNVGSSLILRDVQLAAQGGGHCQLDILIYFHNSARGLVLLECKSASSLESADLQQVRRAVSLLNLGFQRAAVVMPVPPADHLQNRWVEQTGASVIGFAHLQDFLNEALR